MMTLGLKLDNFDINEMTPSLCSLETLNTAPSSPIHQVHQLKNICCWGPKIFQYSLKFLKHVMSRINQTIKNDNFQVGGNN